MLDKRDPFESHTARYDSWFDTHKYAYLSELRAIKKAISSRVNGIEIGVGSGRFAEPLRI